jgi:hypothetical protein
VFYFHTKGVTRYKSTKYIFNDIYEYTIPELEKHIQDWKDCLDYILIKNHEQCISLIKNDHYSTVGVNVHTNPRHYSGHYWWAYGDYLKKLEPIHDENIYNNETWLIGNTKSENIDKKHASLLNDVNYCNYYCSTPLSVLIENYEQSSDV